MRDRLADLQGATSTDDGLEADHVAVDIEEEEQPDFMGDFFNRVEALVKRIKDIETGADRVEHAHGDLLRAVNSTTIEECNQVLADEMASISKSTNFVRRELKVIDKENKKLEAETAFPDGTLPNDVRIRQSQHAALSRKFVDVMTRYNDVQAMNQKKYKEKLRREIKIVYPELDSEGVERIMEKGTEGIFIGQKLDQAEDHLNIIRDRYQEIMELERSLLELHEMFQDMAVLIASQGEMIDRIEYSVTNAHEYVESARVLTKKAERLQSLARHKQICLGVMCLVLIVIVVGVVAGKVG
eukprot:m.479999 g.479999  ORF g.479999 m.479999 type:complete len:299 (+) comp21665_c0_seq1:412-1308(+)